MGTIAEIKERAVTDTPLVLVECELLSGERLYWSTHGVTFQGQRYEPRILEHNLFEIRADSEMGVDGVTRAVLTLANTDSRLSQVERAVGWKGSRVTARFVFFDLRAHTPTSEAAVIFRGIAQGPEEITESTLRLSVGSRLNLHRVLLPEVRIQRRCPWTFPATAAQRGEAATGGAEGKYSPFYRCGYSADIPGGAGNLNGGAPFTSCDYTRESCQQRGMFDTDSQGNVTRRFGGIEFVPSSILVRSHGEKGFHPAAVTENEARYNDFVPLVYGTAWYRPPVVFARNDGNLTRLEVLLGLGEMQGVLKVLVNDFEIPEGRDGTDMTATGWYRVVSLGARTGAFNPDFPEGDPYGSMAFLSVVVPTRVSDGRTLPRIEVLAQGVKLPRYDLQGNYTGEAFDNNPAWVLLDVLRRCGWKQDELDIPSFSRAAAVCAELIPALDVNGNPLLAPRFQCNLVLRRRRSVAEVVRGIQAGSRLYLVQGDDGRLQLRVEDTLARQQPQKPAGSNSASPVNGGWPAYEFGDGTFGFSGILRTASGAPSLRVWSRSTAETPNRVVVEFQDALNEYQQDSLSLVDPEDVLRVGQEVSMPLPALGIATAGQAARAARLALDKAIRGNTYVEFETSVRGVGLKPGDLITLTYLKEGFQRQPFRVKRIAPGLNYRTVRITAQIHDDRWYDDTVIGGALTGRQPSYEVGLPRPLVGSVLDPDGQPQLEIQEQVDDSGDGRIVVWLRAGFLVPPKPAASGRSVPMVSLSPVVGTSGGTLPGGRTYYYAVSAVFADGTESALSFVVPARTPATGTANTVRLTGLSFPPGAAGFHVYRGDTPALLYRIVAHQPLAGEFTDTGLPTLLAVPPDENFDHANFYWRFEQVPETQATIYGPVRIGSDALNLNPNEYRHAVVRITKGRGAGQERIIAAHDATTLTVDRAWATEPDSTSHFVIAEATWHFGAMTRTSPVEFEVPNRVGATVHISGRAANVHNREAAYELSPLTRWRIGGGTLTPIDTDVPDEPVFGLQPTGKGTVELVAIGFQDLTNTRTITAATLTLHYWAELSSPTRYELAGDLSPSDTFVDLNLAGPAQPGSLIQVGAELMRVTRVANNGSRYEVVRGAHRTSPGTHSAGDKVYHLRPKVFIIPFVRDFFGSPASGSFSYSIYLPDVRIASAELFVTNMRGNSRTATASFTNSPEGGLRTLSGGQMSVQVEGYLATQSDVAPPLVVEESHAVRDIFAVVREAPRGGAILLRLRQDSDPYCTLTIPAGGLVSNVVSGFGLPPLRAGAQLSLDILSAPQGAGSFPGRDLTVTLRL
ncbi:MAG: phage tail protein [Bryobacterales bacterium]|nr:phage tail protein [Bryobacteraceae bacterium]MDW8356075.1 phage tail protein [Bryobacterales bacterium]